MKTKRDKKYTPPKPARESLPFDPTEAMLWEKRKKTSGK